MPPGHQSLLERQQENGKNHQLLGYAHFARRNTASLIRYACKNILNWDILAAGGGVDEVAVVVVVIFVGVEFFCLYE